MRVSTTSGEAQLLQRPHSMSRVRLSHCNYRTAEGLWSTVHPNLLNISPAPPGNRRSCHVPLVDDIQAEFRGDSAKLSWNVSIDGKKSRSETYKILAVLDR